MNRRSFLSTVASTPLFSFLSTVREPDEDEILEIYAHYTEYRQEIEYRTTKGSVITIPYSDYDSWFSDVSGTANSRERSVPAVTILSDCDLRAVRVTPDYSKSVFQKDEYEIQIHKGRNGTQTEFYVQYYKTGQLKDMDDFEADSIPELTNELDWRNVIF